MATITLTLPLSGTGVTAGLHSTNYASIQAAVNALDNTNIAVSAAIDPLKLASGWQAYVPVWASTGTQPVLGNGTLTGRFTQIGKTVCCYGTLTAGTTTTYGTGNYVVSFPVASSASIAGQPIGMGRFVQTGVANFLIPATVNTSTQILFLISGGTTAWGSATPFTFGNTHTAQWFVTYEAA